MVVAKSLLSLALLSVGASATFTINFPTAASYWVSNTTNAIRWTTSDSNNPSKFQVYISNTDTGVLVDNTGSAQLGIANNVDAIAGAVDIPSLPEYVQGPGFFLVFTNLFNTSDIFAKSDAFTVQPNTTAPATPPDAIAGQASQFIATTSAISQPGVVVKTTGGAASSVASSAGPIGDIPNIGSDSGSNSVTLTNGSGTSAQSSTLSVRSSTSAAPSTSTSNNSNNGANTLIANNGLTLLSLASAVVLAFALSA